MIKFMFNLFCYLKNRDKIIFLLSDIDNTLRSIYKYHEVTTETAHSIENVRNKLLDIDRLIGGQDEN